MCRCGTYIDIDICFYNCLSYDQFISVFDECVCTHMCVFMALIHIQRQCKYSITTYVRCKCVKTSFCIFCRGCVYVLSRGFLCMCEFLFLIWSLAFKQEPIHSCLLPAAVVSWESEAMFNYLKMNIKASPKHFLSSLFAHHIQLQRNILSLIFYT